MTHPSRPSMETWAASMEFVQNFPEVCPVCKEKWKFCEDYNNHIEAVED